MICLTSTNLTDFDALDATICVNLGLANEFGTTSFLAPRQALNQNFYYVVKPTYWAGNNNEGFTEAQILNGADLSNFTELEYDPLWVSSQIV